MAEANSIDPEPLDPKARSERPVEESKLDQDPGTSLTSAQAGQPVPVRSNPFIGPRPYQTGEQLYGRDREASQLFNLLLANRVMLLYSPSGAGKSSLIYATLIPELQNENFNSLPVMRVNEEPPLELTELPGFNRYVFSALSRLEEALPNPEKMPLEDLARITLEEYAARFDGTRSVLIFDQFEEIMTQDPTDLAAKQEFFRQTAALLRHPTQRALFAMREDHLASLDPFKPLFPMLFANPFRLDLLTRETSVGVLQQIARQEKVDFHKDAAEKLAEDLSEVNLQLPDNTLVSRPGIYVEPVQLQVVGYNLWQKLAPGDQDLTLAEIEEIGDVDQSLGAYYDQKVAEVAQKSGVRERFIREWIDQALITANKIRTQVLRGSEVEYRVDEVAAKGLVDARLIRSETLRGASWYELAHDRLVGPVKQSNAHWFENNLSLLQKQARLWKEEPTHKQALLLRGAGLEQAQAWATDHPADLTEEDRAFLAESAGAYQLEIEEEKRKLDELEQQKRTSKILKRRLWYALIAMGVALLLVVISLSLYVNLEKKQEQLADQERILESGNLSGLAMSANQAGNGDLALLLAVQAYDKHDSYQSRTTLMQLLQSNRGIRQYIKAHTDAVSGLAVSLDGTKMVSLGWDYNLRFWEITPTGPVASFTQYVPNLDDVAYSPTQALVATSGCGQRDENDGTCKQGEIQLWDADTAQPVGAAMLAAGDWINRVVFSPDGRLLASTSGDGQILIWDVETGSQKVISKHGHENYITSLAFNHDPGQPRLATTSCADLNATTFECTSGEIFVWDASSGERIAELSGGESWINSVAFSPDDTLLATGGDDGMVRLWDVSASQEISPALEGHTGSVSEVAFEPNYDILASVGQDGKLILWNFIDHTPIGEPFGGNSNALTALAAIPNEAYIWFATGGEDGNLILWQNDFLDPLEIDTELTNFPIYDMALVPGENQLLIGSCTKDADDNCLGGMIYLYDLGQHEVIYSAEASNQPVTVVAANRDGLWASAGCVNGGASIGFGQYEDCSLGRITLWDAESRQPLDRSLEIPDSRVAGLAFSPDGNYLAASGSNGSLWLWNTADWSLIEDFTSSLPDEFYSGINTLNGLTFTPDGSQLEIAVCTNGDSSGYCRNGEVYPITMEYYSVEDPLRHTGIFPRKLVFSDTESSRPSLAASLDCLSLSPFGCDNSATLWYLESEALPMNTLNRTPSPILSSLAIYPDGLTLVTGYEWGVLEWWDLDPGSWREKACQIAGRNLTEKEWNQYGVSGSSCEQWPAGK
jgi:WD40 repeat protein